MTKRNSASKSYAKIASSVRNVRTTDTCGKCANVPRGERASCTFCGVVKCPDHIQDCAGPNCLWSMCGHCHTKCTLCRHVMCKGHVYACDNCNFPLCHWCIDPCLHCGAQYCPACVHVHENSECRKKQDNWSPYY